MKAVQLLGGKCNRCGWTGNLAAFEFHHKDPEEKEFEMGNMANKAWDVLKIEIEKCELLCSNCHRIEHTDRSEAFIEELKNYKGR
jgi:predicted HNH restriction endonuclease